MAKISLRAYNQEIDNMINEGQIQESVAHCRHILKIFPKHVGTYRLLGKAYLESRQFSNAADIFQRVLSAVPDDFVSQIGMSLIREDEGNIDAATTHMERAFEKQPYNPAIQDELRRLYGKRDGMEPPKVRLTQGALARMYLKGNLIQQGISELRSALSKDPSRTDLKAILAQAYAETNQKTDALEIASNILKDFPHNVISNRILANMLSDDDHPQVMKACKRRLYSLAPYEMHVSKHAPTAEEVPDTAITIEQLDWDQDQEEMVESSEDAQSDWAMSLGVDISTEDDEDVLPSWLSDAESESSTDQEIPPQTEKSEEEQEEFMPDWMQDAGWELSDGDFDESQVDWDDFESEDEITPADIPDWLKEKAPQESEEEILEEEFVDLDDAWLTEIEEEVSDIPQPSTKEDMGESLDWDIELGESHEIAGSEEKTPDWLSEFEEEDISKDSLETERPSPPKSTSESEVEEAKPEEIPDWLSELDQGGREDFDEREKTTPPEAVSAPEAEMTEPEEVPDWLSEFDQEEPEAIDDSDKPAPSKAMPDPEAEEAKSEEIPDWLSEFDQEEPEAIDDSDKSIPSEAVPEPETEKAVEDEVPDWLSELEPETEETSARLSEIEEDEPRALEELEVSSPPDVETEAPGEEFETAEPQEHLSESMENPEVSDEIDEIDEIDEPDDSSSSQVPDLEDEDATMAWLESLAAKQGVPEEELVTSSEDRARSKAPKLDEEESFTESISPSLESETIKEQTEISPESLTDFEDDSESLIETPKPESDQQEIKSEKVDDDEALPAWLSDLKEEEDPQETAVLWLEDKDEESEKTSDEETLESEHPEPGEKSDIPAEKAEEIPDWLARIREEEPDQEEKIQEPTSPKTSDVESEEEELPAWLTDLKDLEDPQETAIAWLSDREKEPKDLEDSTGPEETESPQMPDLEDEEATMAWLENLAAKRGVPEEELVSRPEDRNKIELLTDEVTEKLKSKEDATTIPPHDEPTDEKEEGTPDWLADLREEGSIELETKKDKEELEEKISDWTSELEKERIEEKETEVAPEEQEEIPEWFANIEEEELEETTEVEKIELPSKADQEKDTTKQPLDKKPEHETTEEDQAEEEVSPPAWVVEGSPPEDGSEEYAWISSKEEMPQLIEKLNLNTATISQLEKLTGIGFRVAERIVSYREERGYFEKFSDLEEIGEIDEETLKLLNSQTEVILPSKEKKSPAKHDEPKDEYQALLYEAQDNMDSGKIDKALDIYQKLIEEKEYLDDVIDSLSKATFKQPMNVAILKTLGDGYMQKDQLQEALDAYSKAEDLLR